MVDDNHNNVLVFLRRDRKGHELICAVNFAPVPWEGYRFGVPDHAYYEAIFNTDDVQWGGSGVCAADPVPVEPVPSHGRQQSIALTIPPLGAVILRGHGRRKQKKEEAGGTQA